MQAVSGSERNVRPEPLCTCGLSDAACSAIVKAFDWSKTSLGPIASWSPILRATANLVLRSQYPMCLLWGPELVQLYNDKFVSSVRDMHPSAVGCGLRECWPEIWPIIGPHIRNALETATPSWHEDHLVPIRREGRLEEVYWTYHYSPVFEHDGSVGGVLMTGTDTTSRVLGARRLQTLRELSDRLLDVSTSEATVRAIMDVLGEARCDLPFVTGYAICENGALRRLGTTASNEDVVRTIDDAVGQHFAARHLSLVEDGKASGLLDLPRVSIAEAPWPEHVTRAFAAVLPKPSRGRPSRLMVFGLSPRLPLDEGYRRFLEHLVDRLTVARARTEAHESRATVERQRRDLLRQAPIPTVLWTGPDLRIELANRAFLTLIARDIVGKSFAEAFPHLVGAEIEKFLLETYRTGKPFSADEHRIPVLRNGVPEDRWFKVHLQPVDDEYGRVYGVIEVVVDITDTVEARRTVERYSAEREKLLAQVEAASRAKDEFLAMLGHELRNPLAPITTALHLMKLKQPDVLTREREIIARQSGHLVQLVDDLLDVSRVARGKVRLNRTRVALADVITRAVETASPLFEQRRHTLTVDVAKDGIDVEGDPLRLAQVVANLLTNAAKYTEPGGRVSVSAVREGDVAVIRVADTGVGIPPEHLPHVFDAFFQGPRPPDRAQGGLGLGLALVKSFVSLHRGTVTARAREGGGSVFEVRLPALPRVIREVSKVHAEPPRSSVAPQQSRRVLVVDDSDDILELVSTFLRHEGYEVMAAHDAPSALRLAPEFHPNVAVLDIGLPAMDGYELAQQLRVELGDEAPKMIAMTGYGQEADRERARRAGFAIHLVKPVDPKALLESVRT